MAAGQLLSIEGCVGRREYQIRRADNLTTAERQRALALAYRLHDVGNRALARPLFDAQVFAKLHADAAELVRIVVPEIEEDVLEQMSAADCVRVYRSASASERERAGGRRAP